jgi:hypothetical protein
VNIKVLCRRLERLEAHGCRKATKTVIPEWLVEELRKQGFRFDAFGRPDMTSVSAGAVDNAI